ncbi:hypothetical protein ACFSUK_33705 [Sphingobium scionense]
MGAQIVERPAEQMIDRRETARTAKHARGGRLDGGARNMQEERARTGGADNGRPCNGAKEQRRTSAERLRFPSVTTTAVPVIGMTMWTVASVEESATTRWRGKAR